MIKHDDKLKWLSGRLSELNDHKETVEGEIEATTDVLAEKKLEKRLGIIFEKIEHIKNEIQQEQNNLNSKLVQKKFEDLIAILQSNESLWEQIQQAYQNTRSHWSTKVKDDVDNVQSIVNELNKISQGSLTYSALEEFIANLFDEISDVVVSNALTQWGQEYCQSGDWLSLYKQIQESQSKRLENDQPAIFITITRCEEISQDDTYYLKSWLIKDIETYQTEKTGVHALLVDGSPDSAPSLLDDLLQKAPNLLTCLIKEANDLCKHCANEPQIHVFLPIELMHLGVDVWSFDPTSKRPEYLGYNYLVLFHCTNRKDRSLERQEKKWIKLWRRQQALLQESVLDVFVAGDDSDIDELIDILVDVNPDSADSKVVGLYVTDVPIDIKSLLDEVLYVGLPIAIWCRKDLLDNSHKTQVEELLKSSCLGDLPNKVKKKRSETRKTKNTETNHIGYHLSLLWDDPNLHFPPKDYKTSKSA